jgi:hypothetical protein
VMVLQRCNNEEKACLPNMEKQRCRRERQVQK